MTSTPELATDPDGIPLLTDQVPTNELQAGEDPAEHQSRMSVAAIANDLLDNEVFQRQLDDIAREMSGNIRLQMEQALGIAVENVISEALERNKLRSFELIRRHLENVLPGIVAKVMQDQGLQD